ncbi:Stage IV sporulation pro-sigma-K processing enzyme (SpoIVFB) [Minicystis rosea]|nr:Stage IV sporulation pro-sigma-K processing enzyme (SpoIVFB) [Minicystis rosea]
MFEQGLTVLRIRGIPVRLHLSLLVFLPYVAYVATRQYRYLGSRLGVGPEDLHMPPAFWGIILAVGLFVAVLAHELAHSLVAIRYGARVRSITLMMLGGVSLIEDDLPPRKEAWMAFVGPLASFGIAAVSYALYRFVPLPAEVDIALFSFAVTNAALAIFNMLPAFPMDGGRVVRGVLAGRLGIERATLVASRLGQAMAVLFAVWALWSFNIILLFIAWFVWAGAVAERQRLSILSALRGLHVTDFMSDRLGDAWIDEPVGEVLRRLARAGFAGARVLTRDAVDAPHVAGVVTAEALEGTAERGGAGAPVSAAMDEAPRAVHAGDDATLALGALSRGQGNAVVVLDAEDHVVGLVTAADIRRAVALGRLREHRV